VVERADTPFVKAALADTDRRVGEEKPVAPSFLLACVLWTDVKAGWDQRVAKRIPPFPALQEAIDEVFDARIGDVSGRGKLAADMREIWMMQPRFEKRIGSTPFSLVEQPRFRAGFDFLRLRAEVADVDLTLADWWQEFSMADDAAREDLIQQAKSEKGNVPASGAGKTRRAPRRRKPAAKNASGASGNAEPGQSPSGE
jgi:poly(A) polymerase